MLNLTKEAAQAIALLEAAGYEAYLVGGCVRDHLMGVQPKDYDMATNARTQEVSRIFAAYRVIETGLAHGTVTVLLDGMPLEITTYRIDGVYSDARHPDSVHFSGRIEEDLARRDFTINAMAYHPEKGLIDLYGGREDIQAGCIRCVGEPDSRLREDALRILRALRFASVLGFAVAPETERAIFQLKKQLRQVSAERITAELERLLCGKDAKRVLLRYIEVLGEAIPELLPMRDFDQKNRHHCFDVLTHTAVALEHVPQEPVLRWIMLLHDIGKPQTFFLDQNGVGHFYGHNAVSGEIADQVLSRLRLPRRTREHIVKLVAIHDVPIQAEEREVRRLLSRLGPEDFFALLQVKRADNLGQAPEYNGRQAQYRQVEDLAQRMLEQAPCFDRKQLAVTGKDLMARGYQGREVGRQLQLLLEAVLDGKLPNEKAALLAYDTKQETKPS